MRKSINRLKDFFNFPNSDLIYNQGEKDGKRKLKYQAPGIYIQRTVYGTEESAVPKYIFVIFKSYPGAAENAQIGLEGLERQREPVQGKIGEYDIPGYPGNQNQINFLVFYNAGNEIFFVCAIFQRPVHFYAVLLL
jgi:hypothetical protein